MPVWNWKSNFIEFDLTYFPIDMYLFKFINKNNRIMRQICSKLIVKTPEQRH